MKKIKESNRLFKSEIASLTEQAIQLLKADQKIKLLEIFFIIHSLKGLYIYHNKSNIKLKQMIKIEENLWIKIRRDGNNLSEEEKKSILLFFNQLRFEQQSVKQKNLKDLINQLELCCLILSQKFEKKISFQHFTPSLELANNITTGLSAILIHLLRNSLSHGFKYKVSGEIIVHSQVKNKKLLIYYSDNGKGYDNSKKSRQENSRNFFSGFGLGLQSAHYYSKKIKATLIRDTSCQQGCAFILSLPL